MTNFVLDSFQKLKQKTEMIESLSHIELSKSLVAKCNKEKNELDRINSFYKELNCEINTLEEDVMFLNKFKLYLKRKSLELDYLINNFIIENLKSNFISIPLILTNKLSG